MTRLQALILLLPLFSVNAYANELMRYEITHEPIPTYSPMSYESIGVEIKSDYFHPELPSLNYQAGITDIKIANLTMYPGYTDYDNTYIYVGLSGSRRLSPYINAGIDISSIGIDFLSRLFGCQTDCMPPSSRFVTIGLGYSGSFYELRLYRRFYYLDSDINHAQFAATGLGYSIKF